MSCSAACSIRSPLSPRACSISRTDTTRLASPATVKELAVITDRFNTLAGALDTARAENSRLYRQLITVQEEERRAIANELHDEAGPCLFGITANASSIQTLADQLPDNRTTEISRRVGEILSIADRLKLMNRALLKKLRPGPLGRVKLAELLDELIVGFERRHPDTQVTSSFGNLAESYGETIDLTLYRCIQEGITNAIRHGKAEHLTVDLAEEPAPRKTGKRSSWPSFACASAMTARASRPPHRRASAFPP